MSLSQRVAIVTALAVVACRRDPPPPPRARPAPPLAAPEPARPSPMLAAHASLDASIPPPPTHIPAGATMIGWELAPIDDAAGDIDARWLVLTARVAPPGYPRDLANVGPRAECREVSPPMLRVATDGGAGEPVGALRTVHCESPQPADFSVIRTREGRWEVVRSGCTGAMYPCPPGAQPDTIIARVAIDATGLGELVAGPLTTRDFSPPQPAPAFPMDNRTVHLRWMFGEPVYEMVPNEVARPSVTLVAEGAVNRRLEFGGLGGCHTPPSSARPPQKYARGALATLECESAGGRHHLSVTRDAAMLRIHHATTDSHGTIVEALRNTQRIALIPGVAVVPHDLAATR